MASQTTTENNPRSTSSDYKAMCDYWKMVTAILHGVDALRATSSLGLQQAVAGPVIPYSSLSQLTNTRKGRSGATSPYLPQFPEEENEDYELRRKYAPLTNIYSDVSRFLSSKPFSKTCELDEDTADDLKDLSYDIDGQGNNLHVFAAEVFKAGIDYGIDWIFVDYLNIDSPETITLADERNLGARPYWIRIPAGHLLAVYSDFINGQEIIVHARIFEPFTKRENYSEKVIERVRILNREPIIDEETKKITGYGPAMWELLEMHVGKDEQTKKETTSWQKIEEGEFTIGIIPLVPFKTGRRQGCSWIVHPPLKDIAYMQIEEFQQESNLRTIKELTAFPMLTGNGVSPKDADGKEASIQVGPHAVLYAPPGIDGSPGGHWTFIEPGASSLAFLKADLDGLRTEMRDLGMQPLASANLTVITTANISLRANSQVQAWALGLKDALEMAWHITCCWLNRPDEEVVVRVHVDFGVELQAGAELSTLQATRSHKDISQRTYWEELKRRGVLSDDFDPDIEEERLAEESEALEPEMEIDPVTGLPVDPTQPPPGPRLVAGGASG
jgi:hypothetical protein